MTSGRKIIRSVKESFHSLYIKLVSVILLGLLLAASVFLTVRFVASYYITNYYISEENRELREKSYIDNLQNYVKGHGLSSEDTAELASWAQQNKYVYLLIYKDNELFFTSDTKPEPVLPPDDGEEEGNDGNGTENGGSGGGDGTGTTDPIPGGGTGTTEPDSGNGEGNPTDPEAGSGTGDVTDPEAGSGTGDITDPEAGSGEVDTTDPENGNGDKGNSGGSTTVPNPGFTVEYPTREELFKYAEENDLYPIELGDGTLFASLAEFTEYLYYDITNVLSIVLAMVSLAIVIIIYFRNIIGRIKRLESDVTIVSGGNMDHAIIAGGYDEISRLSTNVENMRKSILYNLEKEREARDANTELITAMSHDIRTPLTVLLGYLEMMRAEAREDGNMMGYIDATEKTAMRLKQLSDDMFKYSLAFGDSAEQVNLEKYDAMMLLEQMLAEHILLMRENGYELVFDVTDADIAEGAIILTDAPNMMRIIDNIFSNLYKYADIKKPIKMSASTSGNILTLTCANTPIRDTSKAESNGIGLKTCKRLARFVAKEFDYGMRGDEFVSELKLEISYDKDKREESVEQ